MVRYTGNASDINWFNTKRIRKSISTLQHMLDAEILVVSSMVYSGVSDDEIDRARLTALDDGLSALKEKLTQNKKKRKT